MNLRLTCLAVAVLSGGALVAPALPGVALAASQAVATPSAVPSGSASVYGIGGVLRGLAGRPLSGICVVASGSGGIVRLARSGPGGRYLIASLPAGAYLVGYHDCAHPGRYLDQWYSGAGQVSLLASGASRVLAGGSRPAWLGSLTLRSADPRVIRSAAKQALARTAALAPAAAPGQAGARRPEVSGVVRTAAGRGIAGACVTATATKGGFELGLGIQTRSDGSYSFAKLPRKPGFRWRIGFSASCTDGAGAGNYAPQWWRYAATRGKATVLRIGSGSHFAGIGARLVKGATISGVVRAGSAHGRGLGSVCVFALGLGAISDVFVTTVTRPDGSYRLTSLGTGRYQVAFEYCGTKRDYAGSDYPGVVSVTDGKDHGGVDAVMRLAGSISGTVTGPGGAPLRGICVVATPRVPGLHLGVEGDLVGTGPAGRYALTELTAGRYTVEFFGCGRHGSYATQLYRGAPVSAGATAVVVAAGQHVTRIGARMRPGGTIAGTVTNASGQPLSGICVSAIAEQLAAGLGPSPDGVLLAQFASSSAVVRTKLGKYQIPDLAPGRYRISFSSGCGKAGAGYAAQWFSPQGGDTADWVSVPGGTPVMGIDARLRRQGAITGVVTGKAGQPAAGICVAATPLSGQPSGNVSYGTGGFGRSDHAGRYQIAGLAAGQYAVSYVSCGRPKYALNWYPGAGTRSSARPVTVTDGHATTGIDQVVVPGYEVHGQLLAGGHTAAGQFCVLAVEAGGVVAADAFTSHGSVMIGPLARGDYTFDVFWCGERATKLAAVTLGLKVPGTRNGLTDFSVVVPEAGSLSGTVLGGNPGARVAGLCVEALPDGPGMGGVAVTGSRGRYTMPGLDPGTYLVRFTECAAGVGGFTSQWFDGTPGRAHATPVAVITGGVRAGVSGTVEADGGIAGTVKVSGSAVAGVCAIAYPMNGRGAPAVAETGAAGQYQIAGVAPGRYLVEFTAGCGAASFATQWFDQVSTRASATPVRVHAGSLTTAIDAS